MHLAKHLQLLVGCVPQGPHGLLHDSAVQQQLADNVGHAQQAGADKLTQAFDACACSPVCGVSFRMCMCLCVLLCFAPQMFFDDDLPVWGFIGKTETKPGTDGKPQTRQYLFTHFHFDIGYNGNQVCVYSMRVLAVVCAGCPAVVFHKSSFCSSSSRQQSPRQPHSWAGTQLHARV